MDQQEFNALSVSDRWRVYRDMSERLAFLVETRARLALLERVASQAELTAQAMAKYGSAPLTLAEHEALCDALRAAGFLASLGGRHAD